MGIFSKIGDAVSDAADWVSDAAEDVASGAKDAAAKAGDALGDLGSAAKDAGRAAANWAGDGVEGLLEGLQDGTNIAGAFDEGLDWLQNAADGAIDSAQEFVEDLPDWVVPAVVAGAVALTGPAAAFVAFGAEAAMMVGAVTVPTAALLATTDLEGALMGAVDLAQEGIGNAIDAAQPAVSELLGRLDEGIAALADSSAEIGDAIRSVPDYVDSTVDAAEEVAEDVLERLGELA